MAQHNARHGDCLLVTIKDRSRQEYVLVFEPARRTDRAKVRQQNAVLADAIYEVLRDHRDDRPFSSEIIPYAYARLGDAARDYPGDHWVRVVEGDKRLGHTGYIFVSLARYAAQGEEPLLQKAEPEGLGRVFRFKASFKYDRSIWRRIELRGSNTLRDFDDLMRSAFNHDTWDHLSEFSYKPKDRGRHAR